DEWLSARVGKVTCSNLGALLGQVSYTSRAQAYRRALGVDAFHGNDATRWGTKNEINGIRAFEMATGFNVRATGLHTHPEHAWLVGSPDGLIGEHVINALLEITGRDWCAYVCWTPEGVSMFDVYRDSVTFHFLLDYYKSVHQATIEQGEEIIRPLMPVEKKKIANRVDAAMKETVFRCKPISNAK
ncbi:MAG: hypothetical protein SGPRY_008768, partial [Prymnesium sp.]